MWPKGDKSICLLCVSIWSRQTSQIELTKRKEAWYIHLWEIWVHVLQKWIRIKKWFKCSCEKSLPMTLKACASQPCLDLAFTLPYLLLDLAMNLPSPCLELALTLPWPCLDLALTLPWPFPNLASTLHWLCLDLALTLPWPCLDLALTLPWPCIDLAFHCVDNSWDIPDMDKCHLDKCCMDKCPYDSWILF